MHRLFVGLRPPAPVRTLLSGAMSGVPGARWQDDAQLHVTLRFVGEVDGGQADDVAAALSTVGAPPAQLAIAGVGRFESRGRVNALWAGTGPRDELTMLHQKIDAALVRAGLDPERRIFLPHVTLARLNAPLDAVRPWLAERDGLRSTPFTIDHFLLYESHLGRHGASYSAVARYALDR